QERPIQLLCKLYPWEWLMADEFGWKVRQCSTRFVEPAWKMLWSTKALLPLLWRRYPNHPLLLETQFEDTFGNLYARGGEWARKPLLGREGANITHVRPDGKTYPTPDIVPQYDKHGYVLQRWHQARTFDGFTPVLGVWMVGDEAHGLGIREDASMITGNGSC